MKEVWKDIVGYEGRYQVSNLGQVKSLKQKHSPIEKLRVLRSSQKGYLQLELSKEGTRKHFIAHRLAATAFVPNPKNKLEVNHIDGNKKNNNISNLEWVTRQENMAHAVACGLSRAKKIGQFDMEGTLIRTFKSRGFAEKMYGFSRHCIQKCCTGINKTHAGYIWKYM